MRENGFHPFNGRVSRRLEEMQMKPNDKYLTYGEVDVYKFDVDSLKDGWLTDSIIAFWEAYLEQDTLPHYKDAHVVLLRPTMSFMLLQTKDPMRYQQVLPSFKGVSHIFLPINDNTNSNTANGGSHWSLVVVSVNDRTAFHYDSSSSLNDREAQDVTNKLSQLLGMKLKYQDLTDSPQQANGSDCGVFVCVIMRHLLVHRLLTAPKSEMVTMSMGDRNIQAAKQRKEMFAVLERKRQETETQTRRSTSSSRFPHSHSRSPPGKD